MPGPPFSDGLVLHPPQALTPGTRVPYLAMHSPFQSLQPMASRYYRPHGSSNLLLAWSQSAGSPLPPPTQQQEGTLCRFPEAQPHLLLQTDRPLMGKAMCPLGPLPIHSHFLPRSSEPASCIHTGIHSPVIPLSPEPLLAHQHLGQASPSSLCPSLAQLLEKAVSAGLSFPPHSHPQ